MIKNQYQYGKTLTLLNISEKESLDQWLTQGSLKKAYDKTVKGYTYILDQNSKWTAPKEPRKGSLALVHPYLII